MHVHKHAAVLNGTQPSPRRVFLSSLLNECVNVCVYLSVCVCRGGRVETSGRRWTGAGHMGHPQSQIISAALTFITKQATGRTHYMHSSSIMFASIHWVSLSHKSTGTIGEELNTTHLRWFISTSRNMSLDILFSLDDWNVSCFLLFSEFDAFTHKQQIWQRHS